MSSVFISPLNGDQNAFEQQQMPEDMRELFKTIAAVRLDIVKSREKRLRLVKQVEPERFAEWDRSVKETEDALTYLERLLEPARIDLQHNNGKLRTKTRLAWMMKDSKSLSSITACLTFAHQRMSLRMLTMQVELDNQHRNSIQAVSKAGQNDTGYKAVVKPSSDPYEYEEEIAGISPNLSGIPDFKSVGTTSSATESMSSHHIEGKLHNGLRNREIVLDSPQIGQFRAAKTYLEVRNVPDSHSASAPVSRKIMAPLPQSEATLTPKPALMLEDSSDKPITAVKSERQSISSSPDSALSAKTPLRHLPQLDQDIAELEAIESDGLGFVPSAKLPGLVRAHQDPSKSRTATSTVPVIHKPVEANTNLDDSPYRLVGNPLVASAFMPSIIGNPVGSISSSNNLSQFQPMINPWSRNWAGNDAEHKIHWQNDPLAPTLTSPKQNIGDQHIYKPYRPKQEW